MRINANPRYYFVRVSASGAARLCGNACTIQSKRCAVSLFAVRVPLALPVRIGHVFSSQDNLNLNHQCAEIVHSEFRWLADRTGTASGTRTANKLTAVIFSWSNPVFRFRGRAQRHCPSRIHVLLSPSAEQIIL